MSAAESAAIVLNVLAFVGAGAFLLFHADERRRSPVDTRLSAMFLLLMALVGVRATRWAIEAPVLQRIEEALAAALPFVAGDFLYAAGLSPWRAGGIALLLFVYATARLTATGAGGTAVLADLALAVFGAGVAFMTLVALVGPPDLVTGGAWLLVIFGIVLVILIVQALRERDTALGRQELLTALADAPPAPLDAFIDHVLASPMLARATVLEGAGLHDFDDTRVRVGLDAAPVLTMAEARRMGGAGEPLVALMETHEATHLVVLARTPLRLLVVNMPGLSSGPDVAVQLTLLHRLAMAAERTA